MATILMVDDDAELLDLYNELLSDDFNVLTAHSVGEATTLLAEERVDAMGCDYHLNDGCGLDVVAWVAIHHPDLLQKTVLISGEAYPPLHGFNIKCLYKPVPLEDLLNLFCAWFTATDREAMHVIHTT